VSLLGIIHASIDASRRTSNDILAQKSVPENIKDELDNTKFTRF